MASSRKFLLCIFWFLCSVVLTILLACSTIQSGWSMLSCYHGVQGKDAFYLTPRRMIQVGILMMVSFKGNSRSYVLGCKYSLTIYIYIYFAVWYGNCQVGHNMLGEPFRKVYAKKLELKVDSQTIVCKDLFLNLRVI